MKRTLFVLMVAGSIAAGSMAPAAAVAGGPDKDCHPYWTAWTVTSTTYVNRFTIALHEKRSEYCSTVHVLVGTQTRTVTQSI